MNKGIFRLFAGSFIFLLLGVQSLQADEQQLPTEEQFNTWRAEQQRASQEQNSDVDAHSDGSADLRLRVERPSQVWAQREEGETVQAMRALQGMAGAGAGASTDPRTRFITSATVQSLTGVERIGAVYNYARQSDEYERAAQINAQRAMENTEALNSIPTDQRPQYRQAIANQTQAAQRYFKKSSDYGLFGKTGIAAVEGIAALGASSVNGYYGGTFESQDEDDARPDPSSLFPQLPSQGPTITNASPNLSDALTQGTTDTTDNDLLRSNGSGSNPLNGSGGGIPPTGNGFSSGSGLDPAKGTAPQKEGKEKGSFLGKYSPDVKFGSGAGGGNLSFGSDSGSPSDFNMSQFLPPWMQGGEMGQSERQTASLNLVTDQKKSEQKLILGSDSLSLFTRVSQRHLKYAPEMRDISRLPEFL